MRSLRLLLPLACLLALLGAGSAFADDDQPVVDQAVIWVFKKGDQVKELDVTHIGPELRKALDTQLQAEGWARSKKTPVAAPKQKAEAKEKRTGKDLRKDLEELARRGGRMREGFIPHGMGPGGPGGPLGGMLGGMMPGGAGGPPTDAMLGGLAQAVGQLLLTYLDVKNDPLKGPIYEGILRDLAKGLVDAGAAAGSKGPDGSGGGLQKLGMQMMGRFMAGMQDPAKAPVYREIMQVFGRAMSSAMASARAPRAAPKTAGTAIPALPLVRPVSPTGPLPFKDAPAELGGARLGYVTPEMSSSPFTFKVLIMGPLDSKSLAAQAGLRAGDQIQQIDGKPTDPAGIRRAHKVFQGGGKLLLRVRRMDGRTEVLDIELEYD